MRLLALLFLFLLSPALAFAAIFEDGKASFDRKDYKSALAIWLPLAEKGDYQSQYELGKMYDYGLGVQQDYSAAMSWYRKSADQGFDSAQIQIGEMYEFGRGVPRNYDAALEWFLQSADRGNSEAMLNIGFVYWGGLYRQDLAMKWFKDAATRGNIEAENMVGQMYVNGQGVKKDNAEAVKWYRMAAELDDRNAQNMLSQLLAKGDGLEPDYIESYKWLVIASGGNPHIPDSAKGEAFLAGKMSQAQIDEAKHRAMKWMAKSHVKPEARPPCPLIKGLGWKIHDIPGLKLQSVSGVSYFSEMDFSNDGTVTMSSGPVIGPLKVDTYDWQLFEGRIQIFNKKILKEVLTKISESKTSVTVCHSHGFKVTYLIKRDLKDNKISPPSPSGQEK